MREMFKLREKSRFFAPSVLFWTVLFIWSVMFRVIKIAPNFSPMGAIAILCGWSWMQSRHQRSSPSNNLRYKAIHSSWLLAFPFFSLLVGDLFLGFYDLMFCIYSTFAVSMLLAALAEKIVQNKGWNKISNRYFVRLSIGLLSSTLFFLVTNAAVWKTSGMYASDASGLIQSYIAGLPFWLNQLKGDVFFTLLLFALKDGVEVLAPSSVVTMQPIQNFQLDGDRNAQQRR